MAARLTQGVSPHALYAAWFDWASHLANAPGRLIELGLEAVNLGARYAQFADHPEVRYGLTAMCVGIGQGGTVIWENTNWEGDK